MGPSEAYLVNSDIKQPKGREYPVLYGYWDQRFSAEQLLNISEMGNVDRILYQVLGLMMQGRSIQVNLPAEADAKALAHKAQIVKGKLLELDKRMGTERLMSLNWIDCITFGSGLTEVGWGKVDGWTAPEYAIYLDATSFDWWPPYAVPPRFVTGRILRGIVYDAQERHTEYWQRPWMGSFPINLDMTELAEDQRKEWMGEAQSKGARGIPEANILHIKDTRSRYPDGRTYLAGIAATAMQLEAVRKSMMQRVNRIGAPPLGIKVNEIYDEKTGLSKADPFGRIDAPRYKRAYDAAVDIAKNYGGNSVQIYWPEHEPQFQGLQATESIIEYDTYLKAEILNHLIPRDWVEQNGAAVSKSSAPLLDLALMVVRGWRKIIAAPYELLYTEILEQNGFEGWSVEFTFEDPNTYDPIEIHREALQLWPTGGITIDRLYEVMGWEPLTDEEREQIKERQEFLASQKKQAGGWGGGGSTPAEEPVEGESAPEEEGDETPPIKGDSFQNNSNPNHDEKGRFASGSVSGGKFDETELATFSHYQGAGYGKINSLLRKGDKATNVLPKERPEVQAQIVTLEKAIDRSPLDKEERVFKGISETTDKEYGLYKNFDRLEGAIITDKGFCSTAASVEIAAEHARSGGHAFRGKDRPEKGIIAVIKLPKGTKAARLEGAETEILVQHGTRFRVTGTSKPGPYWRVDMEA
ncbi:MAG TPA: ADP-ribosyltransferase, partial [Methanotrichaceae archaeon]|nr:ADP-ribosyltransferase [Methanotrichaceae archaeon]